MKKIFILYSLVLFGFMVLVYGCSEVKKDLAVSPSPELHPSGWIDPSSADFHGAWFSGNDWNLNGCKSCHGGDYSGGTSGVSCNTCHTGGPEACNTCHGNNSHIYPPLALNGASQNTDRGVGSHVKHMITDSTKRFSKVVPCIECHLAVSSFSDPNHIIKDRKNAAGVVFGTLANTVTEGITPNPQWDQNQQTCSSVYCHGMFKNGNNSAAPVFNDPSSVVCGSCHGNPTTGSALPGGTHPSLYPSITQCWLCHGGVMNSNGTFKDRTRHVNGIVDIGIK